MKKAIVIGSGFAGLSAASHLAKNGMHVTVLEKHNMPGGRLRYFKKAGYTFEIGPSWYWMPDVFENYFEKFGKKVWEYYTLERLNPAYRVYWEEGATDIPADMEELKILFDSIEEGSSQKLEAFLKEAAYKYHVGINKLVYKPGRSITEFLDIDIAKGLLRLDVFTNMRTHLKKYFKNPRLRQLMEFPVLFLGAMPQKIPALYSLMNYADLQLGTWYPQGGMYKIVEAMHSLACELGVQFRLNTNVEKIEVDNGSANKVITSDGKIYEADVVIANADYHFVETKLLDAEHRSYTDAYWESRTMAPSCLLFFVGVNKKLNNLTHHSLFFDVDFDKHGTQIYEHKAWPGSPLFYVCAPSVTDGTIAPQGCENLFFLIPIAPGLQGDDEAKRKEYFDIVLQRFEQRVGEPVKEYIAFCQSYCVSNFMEDYNAFKGNAYGLANTLKQTSIFKPSIRSKKVKNLFYTGQLTVPGPGVPPSLISGEVVAKEVLRHLQ